MKETSVPLWNRSDVSSSLTVCAFSDRDAARPAMLVVPGGGYSCVCRSTEGDPVARRFAELGFRTFILDYRVAPHRFPEPQQDISRAIRLIRHHAAEWRVVPENVAVCGFSAGGHLCACAGILPEDEIGIPVPADEADALPSRPDAMLLCYPVVTSGKYAHTGSFRNLLGKAYSARRREFSLETRVSRETAPAFLWHTLEDAAVPPENTLLLAQALRKHGVLHEVHLFPRGPHGMALGYGRSDIGQWQEQATAFLRGSCGFRFPEKPAHPRTVVLTFDDACKSHLESVAPILKRFGFGATFFICRFSDEWRRKNGKHLLSGREVKELSDQGFEIGNHTWSHPDLRKCAPAEIEREIVKLNDFLTGNGVPKPVSFAYPGGPFAENAVPLLKKHGFRAARTTEAMPWEVKKHDPMRIPSTPLQHDMELAFYLAVGAAGDGKVPVLLFHGVPDPVHEWVNTSPEFFAKCMKYLYENDYRVISMRRHLEESGLL